MPHGLRQSWRARVEALAAAARTSTAFHTGRVSELDPSRGGAFVLLPRRARGLSHAARRPAPPAAARWEPAWAGEGGLFLEVA